MPPRPADIAKLGSRASGGCVHLAPDDAATLFELIQASYGGPVPRFAYDYERRTGSNRGDFMRNRQGELKNGGRLSRADHDRGLCRGRHRRRLVLTINTIRRGR